MVYNHGGLGNQIGGAPAETCEALAQAGFVGFSPIRRLTKPLAGHLDDVLAGVDYVRNLDYVDQERIGIMGFSRGGFLTFMAATARPKDFEAIVIMASAVEILDGYLSRVDKISAPVLLLISENDNARQNHVQVMHELNEALQAAGKRTELIIYPPYQDDGHRMFFEVGDYWNDVQVFLHKQLEKN